MIDSRSGAMSLTIKPAQRVKECSHGYEPVEMNLQK